MVNYKVFGYYERLNSQAENNPPVKKWLQERLQPNTVEDLTPRIVQAKLQKTVKELSASPLDQAELHEWTGILQDALRIIPRYDELLGSYGSPNPLPEILAKDQVLRSLLYKIGPSEGASRVLKEFVYSYTKMVHATDRNNRLVFLRRILPQNAETLQAAGIDPYLLQVDTFVIEIFRLIEIVYKSQLTLIWRMIPDLEKRVPSNLQNKKRENANNTIKNLNKGENLMIGSLICGIRQFTPMAYHQLTFLTAEKPDEIQHIRNAIAHGEYDEFQELRDRKIRVKDQCYSLEELECLRDNIADMIHVVSRQIMAAAIAYL